MHIVMLLELVQWMISDVFSTSANKYPKNNAKRRVTSAQPVVKYVIGCRIHKERDLNTKFISFNYLSSQFLGFQIIND
jgi:hypothetical protein